MQDNEFEKQVHRKMGELRLDPSETVWKNVRSKLRREKKRRRFLAWFTVSIAFLSLGGYFVSSFVLFNNQGKGNFSFNNHVTAHKIDSAGLTNGDPRVYRNKKSPAPGPIATSDKTYPGKKVKLPGSAPADRLNDLSAALGSGDIRNPGSSYMRGTAVGPGKSLQRDKLNRMASGATRIKQEAGNQKEAKAPVTIPVNVVRPLDETGQVNQDQPYIKALLPVAISAGGGLHGLINTSLTLSHCCKLTQASAIKLNRKKTGQFGFGFEAGRSQISSGRLASLFASADAVSSAPLPVQNSGSSNLLTQSPLKAGPAFSAGFYYRKQLTRRFAVSAGINYLLYASAYQVGEIIDTTVTPQSYTLSQSSVTGYFRVGSTVRFVNRYHFLEIPVTMHAQLTRKRETGVFWDLGFSLSRLIAANALNFDSNSRIYYKDNNVFNKTQLNVITGLPVRFYSTHRFSFQAGPQLHYGVSNLLHDSPNGTHLFEIGLKAGIQIK